ncbi:anaphase promoting complex subunit 5 [Xylographa opegraphella]|nr:anaphase promoting complex subunit 5 [Xylographa opegraphella]
MQSLRLSKSHPRSFCIAVQIQAIPIVAPGPRDLMNAHTKVLRHTAITPNPNADLTSEEPDSFWSMSRYLNAPKLGLLALISLYGDSVVPTAAIVPLLSFVVSFLLPQAIAGGRQSREEGYFSASSIGDIREATIVHASGIPGRTLWDLFLKKLWEVNSFDQLHVFFDSLGLLLPKSPEEAQKDADVRHLSLPGPIRFSRNSLFGVFLRRAQLEFTRMQLHDITTLWKSFVFYRNPTLSTWRRRNPGSGQASYDINDRQEDFYLVLYRDTMEADHSRGYNSVEDIEKLLDFQRDRMQGFNLQDRFEVFITTTDSCNLATGNRITEDMQRQLTEMIQAGTNVPALFHYVNFLDAWKCGDYPSSFDNLHRFYDYTMHNRDRTFYQYALLNLAILQKDFGCLPEAVTAMRETISAARENKDLGCLNFSLSWLHHLSKAYPTEIHGTQKGGVLGNDREALVFMKAKAKESGMWGLLSTTFLSEAGLALVNGESVSMALENITKASYLSFVKNVPSTVAGELRLQSSVFSRLGISCIACSLEELLLECHFEHSSAEELLQALSKRACEMALKGRHGDALVRMENIDPGILRTLKHRQCWRTCVDLLHLQHALHRDDLNAAEHFLSQLQANPPSDRELSFPIMVLEVNVQLRQQNYSNAILLLEKHAGELQTENADILFRVFLMTLKAQIYNQAGLAQKAFSIAIRAACLAYEARLLPSLWQAVIVLCQVLNSLQEFDGGLKLLRAIIPQALECEDCELAGTAFSALADTHIGIAGKMLDGSIKQKEHMTRGLGYLEMAFDEYARGNLLRGQCEMLAKKATILHLNGDLVLANDCAARYLAILKTADDEVLM